MKMARASDRDIKALLDFFHEVEEAVDNGDDPEDIGQLVADHWPAVGPAWCRIVYGYQVLRDNATDPGASALEWRPDIAAALQAAGITTDPPSPPPA